MKRRIIVVMVVLAMVMLGEAPVFAADTAACGFPHHSDYAGHYLAPSVGQASVDEATEDFYNKWKKRYIAVEPYYKKAVRKYVWYDEAHRNYRTAGKKVAVTVSEAQGYGMIITATMAGYDPDARATFDALYRFYRAHLSKANKGTSLMAWQQSDNGRKLVNSGGVCSATDGDIDIAYGLLLADRQWGSSGDIDYKGAALKIIGDIYKYEINHKTYTVQYGDWVKWSSKQSREYTGTRSSDFITAEFRAFAAASGNNGWNKVTARCYSLMSRVNKVYSGRTGLMPDFMYMKKNGKYRPELKYKRESALDGGYGYNACRDPWRIGTDYLVSGSSRARYQTSLLNRWIRKKTGGDPSKIRAGYTLKGKIRAGYSDMCFTAPFLVAAVCDTSGTAGAQKWVDSLWNEIVSAGTTNYYNDTIKLLTMITAGGNFI